MRPFARGPEAELHLALRDQFPNAEVVVVEHHLAHAASAFFASPFEEATVLTLDHAGDFRCGARWHAAGNQIELEKEWYYPDSLGRLYGAVTELLGFRAGADEHKVQWLSASGDDRFAPLFREIVSDAARLDRVVFRRPSAGGGGFSAKFFDALGLADGAKIPPVLAPSIARGLAEDRRGDGAALAGEGENLCLAGGLFFNALLVEFLERSGRWKNVFVQAAAGNAGTALGAVYHVWHHLKKRPRHVARGLAAAGSQLRPRRDQAGARKLQAALSVSALDRRTAGDARCSMLGEHKIVAWMQGRMEFGPRALGNRSILASPLDPYSTENLNVFIKHREPFRKFAASVPAEVAAEYFDAGPNARTIATVGRVRAAHQKTFASAILGEDMVRVHTVDEADNPLYPPPAARSRQGDGTAGALQHQLQSVRRSAGLDAARCGAELLFVGDRRVVRGEFSAGEVERLTVSAGIHRRDGNTSWICTPA